MRRPDALGLVVEIANAFLSRLESVTSDDAENLVALEEALEDGVHQLRALVALAAGLNEHDPGEAELRFVRDQSAVLAKISAAALAVLVLIPVEREHLGGITAIVARAGRA